MFYINYVVCKWCKIRAYRGEFICFILTMWYVNYVVNTPTAKDLLSFILTMWYVNLTKRSFLVTARLVLY